MDFLKSWLSLIDKDFFDITVTSPDYTNRNTHKIINFLNKNRISKKIHLQ